MDTDELAESLQEVDADTPYYETLILDFDERGPYWACNLDGREIELPQGCPDHAPRDIPGLHRAECEATPPHTTVWVVDGDHTGYGVPCPTCMYNALSADFKKATKSDRCYHRGWRRWKLTRKVVGWLYTSGICSSGGGSAWGDGCDWCLFSLPRLRGKRPYILGVRREVWRCWLVGHHRRGDEVGFGFCGKCVPMPCCGSQTLEHVAGYRDDERAAVAS